jgi:Reverse transcriptase (RNA-dependent DNA polymerase)
LTSLLRPPVRARKSTDLQVTIGRKVGPNQAVALGPNQAGVLTHHTDLRWVLLYVERWLKAPLQRKDGSQVERDCGTPQGSAISPLLANMFLHYAFDAWMTREFPGVQFERYCDDIIVHARSERQALQLRVRVAERLAECGFRSTSRRPASCTARMPIGAALMSTRRLTSCRTRSARGCRRAGSGSIS